MQSQEKTNKQTNMSLQYPYQNLQTIFSKPEESHQWEGDHEELPHQYQTQLRKKPCNHDTKRNQNQITTKAIPAAKIE